MLRGLVRSGRNDGGRQGLEYSGLLYEGILFGFYPPIMGNHWRVISRLIMSKV